MRVAVGVIVLAGVVVIVAQHHSILPEPIKSFPDRHRLCTHLKKSAELFLGHLFSVEFRNLLEHLEGFFLPTHRQKPAGRLGNPAKGKKTDKQKKVSLENEKHTTYFGTAKNCWSLGHRTKIEMF